MSSSSTTCRLPARCYVEELDMNDGTSCAGKRIHEIFLISAGVSGRDQLATRFFHECKIASMLRHPHIVQFLGVFHPVGSRLPTLVMEKMQYNLHDILERTVNRSIGFAAKFPFFMMSLKVLYICTNATLFIVISQHAIFFLILQ